MKVSPCPPHILRAYNNGDFTDLIISCGKSEFAVHSLIVGSACDFFAKSLKFPGKEAEKRRIDMQEDDPEMIRRLIAYLYVGDYDPSDDVGAKAFGNIKQYESLTEAATAIHLRNLHFVNAEYTDRCACLAPNPAKIEQPVIKSAPLKQAFPSSVGETLGESIQVSQPLTIHATMYALADKYQVTGLGDVAKTKFKDTLHHHSNSEDFINAIQIAYSSTPESNRGLRDAVLKAFQVHFQVNVAAIPGLEAKLETIDELSFLLIKSWPKKMGPAKPEYGSALLDEFTPSERKYARPTGYFGTMPGPPGPGGFGTRAFVVQASSTNP